MKFRFRPFPKSGGRTEKILYWAFSLRDVGRDRDVSAHCWESLSVIVRLKSIDPTVQRTSPRNREFAFGSDMVAVPIVTALAEARCVHAQVGAARVPIKEFPTESRWNKCLRRLAH